MLTPSLPSRLRPVPLSPLVPDSRPRVLRICASPSLHPDSGARQSRQGRPDLTSLPASRSSPSTAEPLLSLLDRLSDESSTESQYAKRPSHEEASGRGRWTSRDDPDRWGQGAALADVSLETDSPRNAADGRESEARSHVRPDPRHLRSKSTSGEYSVPKGPGPSGTGPVKQRHPQQGHWQHAAPSAPSQPQRGIWSRGGATSEARQGRERPEGRQGRYRGDKQSSLIQNPRPKTQDQGGGEPKGTAAQGKKTAGPRPKVPSGAKPIGFVPPLPGGAFPFHDFVHSYSETPKIPPLGYREPLFSPFGPDDMAAPPWTGGAPLKKGKERIYAGPTPGLHRYTSLRDLHSTSAEGSSDVREQHRAGAEKAAAQGQRGAGPAVAGAGQDSQGAPLSEEEVERMVQENNKDKRQVNLGRDGLVHNMVRVIHDHWKRRPLCRIKCKGVPTVDMDNVVRTIEARTGGKVVRRAGGTLYVFRGRRYDPKKVVPIPLMLWKPPSPVYPPLIEDAPPGLTLEEANVLRIWGRRVKAICRLAKNGVYLELVDMVRGTLAEHPLCRVDARGLDKSDLKKVGAKLRDLVPCVLLSFERDQILMWRDHPDKRPRIVHTEEGIRLVGVGKEEELSGADLAIKGSAEINGAGSWDDSSSAEEGNVGSGDSESEEDGNSDQGHQEDSREPCDEVFFV